MNTEEFISRAIIKHKYDYSMVDYKNYHTKVTIICDKHGQFAQTPAEFFRGRGCPKCYLDSISITTNSFIQKATVIHGDKYNYTKVSYKRSRIPIIIICKTHGEFTQLPFVHLNGSGCPSCYKQINSTSKFIDAAKIKHGDKYDYTQTKYKDHKTKLTIYCKIHGQFQQKPRNHINGAGCQQCAKESCILSHHKFISMAIKVHGNQYDYSQTKYQGAFTIVKIICSIHGIFHQLPSNHLRGAGCPQCAKEQQRLTIKTFIEKAQKTHNNKYDYSKTAYVRMIDKIDIICPEHGIFNQKAANHVNGQGCPNCQTVISSGHSKILSMIPDNIIISNNNRNIIKPYEIDIFLPEYQFGIEYHGCFWHSEHKYQMFDKYKCLKKHQAAVEHNISLYQFFEYEVITQSQLIESMIIHAIGLSTRIGARKCIIVDLSEQIASKFFTINHILGHRFARYYFGLIYNDTLVAAISISKNPIYQYEIMRYACRAGYAICGGFSRLLNHFIKLYSPDKIMSYADKRFSTGVVYYKNGFELINSTKPNYRYINFNTKTILSRQQCQKHKLPILLGSKFNINQSEYENMINNGYGKIWDAGSYKFILRQ